jgi:endonuclease III
MSADEDKKYLSKVMKLLRKRYKPDIHTMLHFTNAWELLVATMLSAQSQDMQVNKVTPALFKKFKTIDSFARLRPNQIYPYIKTLGLYRNKGKNIIGTAKAIRANFGSAVPKTMEELVSLPGVGRKTANVVLSNALGTNSGIAIDTHCITVSNRLHLVKTKNAEMIEEKLMPLVPRSEWSDLSHLFIALGRDTCQARVKYCDRCVLKDICPSAELKNIKDEL